MTTRIRLTPSGWIRLSGQLHRDYPKSTVMISWQRQQTLGFDMTTDILDNIVLTFPDDRKATMFRLKYGEYLEQADNPISNSFSIV